MEYEKQLKAMKSVMEALQGLEEKDRVAVMGWVNGQLGIKPPTTQTTYTVVNGAGASPKLQGTVSVVAQKLGVASARDLLEAAAAYLTLYQSKDAFSKDELVACAKEARMWKTAYSNQMAKNVNRMQEAGTLFERSRGVFSLSDKAIESIKERLKVQ
jgi:hypothetical protein